MKSGFMTMLLLLIFATGCNQEGFRDLFQYDQRYPSNESNRRAYLLALASGELGKIRGHDNFVVHILLLEARLAAGDTEDVKAITGRIPDKYRDDPYIYELFGDVAYKSQDFQIAESYYQIAKKKYSMHEEYDQCQ